MAKDLLLEESNASQCFTAGPQPMTSGSGTSWFPITHIILFGPRYYNM